MALYPKPVVFFLLLISTLSFTLFSSSVPFVYFHGINSDCSDNTSIERLSILSGAEGYCIEIGNGVKDSLTMPLMEQAEIACNKVKNIDALSDGYNIVAHSQGNMVARGLIEFCDGGPSVKNFIALAGPHAGVAACPSDVSEEAERICKKVDIVVELGLLYTPEVQEQVAPSNYFKIPTDIKNYLEGCKYLPLLNNEIAEKRSATYKERFSSLEKLVLIKFENDMILIPKETAWFGYYADGEDTTVLPYDETELYIQDWIGLKSLNEAGKVAFISAPGGHADITESVMENYIVPYLEDREDESSRSRLISKRSSSRSSA